MKSLRVMAFACTLCMWGAMPALAQFKLNKDAIQKMVEKKMEEGGGAAATGEAGTRRRAAEPAGGKAGKPNLAEMRAFEQARKKMEREQGGKGGPGILEAYRRRPIREGGGAVPTALQGAVQQIVKKKITVIAGNRVTDAVTGELLDDAREIRVDEEQKSEYFDDGTHGDLVAGDGQYTRVAEIKGVLGPNNQRLKEQLVQAVYEISRLEAQEFYGHTLLAADNSTRPERNARWALVEAPEGRAGFRLSESATDKPAELASYWDEELSRDEKIAGPNGWARTFLDEYRITKGELDSEFYEVYVPEPPGIPKLPPPSVDGWSPFSLTISEDESSGGASEDSPFGNRKGKKNKDNDTAFQKKPSKWKFGMGGGGAQDAAADFVNRGAGAGSTSGGYFSAQ